MRKLLGFLLFGLLSVSAWPQAAVTASRRHGEKTPLQYSFGSFTAVAPYNEANGYTVIPTDAQLQPPNLAINSNNFSSTGNFTAYGWAALTQPTFTVASNVGTIASTSGTGTQLGGVYLDTGVSYSIAIPAIFVQITVNQNDSGGTGGDEFVGPLIGKDGNNLLAAVWSASSKNMSIDMKVSGTDHFSSATVVTLTAPWKFGLLLSGNNAYACYNTGSGWTCLAPFALGSFYNFLTDGNLAGWHEGFVAILKSTSSWQVSALSFGGVGGFGTRDIQLVTYPDGRPYMQGSVAYFTATNNPGACSVFSYDVVGGTLTEISTIWADTGTQTVGLGPDHLIYDPQAGTYRLWMSGFAINPSSPPIYYVTFAKSSIDPLSPGIHVVSGYSTITFPTPGGTTGWDESAACSQWNYSADSCSKWIACYADWTAGIFYPACASTTSEPSSGSTWTSIGQDGSSNGFEGSRVLRTATTSGSSGVTYSAAWGGLSVSPWTRSARVYNSIALTYLGNLSATLPAGTANAPHPQIFSYGNTEYFVTFNDNLYSGQLSTMGNWLVATAPKY